MDTTTSYNETCERAYRQMEARRRGEERAFLHVKFLRGPCVERERVLEVRYACRAMEAWTSRGTEYKVRNQPVELPRFGIRAGMVRKVKYVRREARHRDVRL
jgi:hypothetical protein